MAAVAALALFLGAPPPAKASALTLKGTYQETVAQNCANTQTTVCEWRFALVPAGKFLTVTHVSCRFVFNQTGGYLLLDAKLGVRQQPGNVLLERYDNLTPVQLSSQGTTRIWVLNNETLHLVSANERPIVFVTLAGAARFLPQDTTQHCTVSGTLRAQ